MIASPLFRLCLVLALPLSAACVGDVGGPLSDQDDFFEPDEGQGDQGTPPGGGGDDLPPSGDGGGPDEQGACGVPVSIADLGARTGQGYKESENGSDFYELSVVVNPGPPDDVLWIGLFAGYGAFANGNPAPGTYTIAGDDASAVNCGTCVLLDINATEESAERSLMAVSGQLTIEQVGATVSGRAENLILQEIDQMSGAPVSGGCSTSIASVTFSASIQ